MNAIVTEGLSKQFKTKFALNNLDMKVPEGSIYGFIGQNGAGKSTAQKLMCGLLVPSKGNIQLFEKPHTDPDERARIGVLIENPACFMGLSAYENLMIQSFNIGLEEKESKVKQAIEMVGLTVAGKKKAREFSLGMKQRLGVASALLGSPKLLILDEPINGLDPEGIMEIRQTLLNLNRNHGMTILISSHILGELSKIATHYGIIKDGAMVQEISASDLSKKSEDYLCIKTDNPTEAYKFLQQKLAQVKCELFKDEVRLFAFSDGGYINRMLFQMGITASEITFHQLDLEEYFLRLMGGITNVKND